MLSSQARRIPEPESFVTGLASAPDIPVAVQLSLTPEENTIADLSGATSLGEGEAEDSVKRLIPSAPDLAKANPGLCRTILVASVAGDTGLP